LPFRIIPYTDIHQPVFKQLNLEWLDAYHLTEPRDLDVLDNPRETILNTGGIILLAEIDGVVVGSAALMREHDGIYELAKMGVSKDHQGKGISKLLMEECLRQATAMGVEKIILFSNHQLKAALRLYEKYGFKYVDIDHSPFLTADIKMELMVCPPKS
jgi:putative acetyltransferase